MLDERIVKANRILWMSAEYEKGNEAKKLLEEVANEGNGDAYFILARCAAGPSYVNAAFGFGEDDNKSEEYLNKSIELGSALGMFGARRFGGYEPPNGSYLHAPYDTNKKLWDAVLAMAEAGDPFSQYLIANAYYYGDCIELMEVDEKSLSDEAGYLMVLGFMDEAEKWYDKAVRQGFVQAIGNYVNMLTSGDYGRDKNPDKAMEIKEIGAKAGVPYYLVDVGIHYATRDTSKAIEYLEKGLNRGNKNALYGLGLTYSLAGKSPDLPRSIEYFEEALRNNCHVTGCKNRLGEIYYYGGKGIEADPAKAFSYLVDLEADNNWGSDMRGMCYLRGWGVAQDYTKAKQQLEIYSDNKLNAIGLGEIYAYGLGVSANIGKAMTIWNRFPNEPEIIEHKKNFKKGFFGWKRINKV